jgi:hypothetical protein
MAAPDTVEIQPVSEATEAEGTEAKEVEDLVSYDACTDCDEWSTMYAKVVAQLEETKEHLNVYKADRVKQMAEFTAFKREHHVITRGIHDLNKLRTVCQDLQNLCIPITEYHSSPEDVAMILQLEPEAKRTAFIDPLKELPPGTWGEARVIRDEANTPQLVANTKGDNYFIAKSFSEYRTKLAIHLSSHGFFKCTTCALPLHTKYKWCVCMRCLRVVYCSVKCLADHKPAHLGCHKSHVWDVNIKAPTTEDEAKAPNSSSSSGLKRKADYISTPPTAQAKGQGKGKGKGTGKGKGKGQSTIDCRNYYLRGACSTIQCPYRHNRIKGTWAEDSFQGKGASQGNYTVEEDDADAQE